MITSKEIVTKEFSKFAAKKEKLKQILK